MKKASNQINEKPGEKGMAPALVWLVDCYRVWIGEKKNLKPGLYGDFHQLKAQACISFPS